MPPKRARKAPLGAASTKTKAQKATSLPTQFQSRFKALESLYKKQVKALSASYTRLLKQVPKSVGKMTVREWLKQESCNALNGGSNSNGINSSILGARNDKFMDCV